MGITAALPNQGALDTVNTSVYPEIWNPGETADLVTKTQPFLWVMQNILRENKEIGLNRQINVMLDQSTGAGSFDGYQLVNPQTWDGSSALLFGRGHHLQPMQMALTEELDLTASGTVLKDRILEMRDQAVRGLAREIYEAAITGNANDSNSILGLEQALPDVTHRDPNTEVGDAIEADDNTNLKDWYLRQDTSTYGGITRTAWDATSAGFSGAGNYLTPVSMDFFDSIGTLTRTFTWDTNNQQHEGLVFLDQIVDFITVGDEEPDFIISTKKPLADYRLGAADKTAIRRAPGAADGFDFPFKHVMYDGMIWVGDNNVATINGTDSAAGDENVYIINTNTWRWTTDPRVSFQLIRVPTALQLASLFAIMVRHQLWCRAAGYNARIFSYPS